MNTSEVLLVIIYTRFSTDMQRKESCDDQVRNVREALSRMGISTKSAVVLRDEEVSGTKETRAGYDRIKQMVERRQPFLLAVDDQSRLSRGDNVKALIRDLVYVGGRFISTGVAIDTLQPGWELKVGLMELHHSMAIGELGRRVHRGQKGRVLEDGSVGDFPFGYESFFLDPAAAEAASARGPKPKRGIRIYELEARWVRQIFEWFTKAKWSIGKITRELNRLNVPKGRRSSKPGWHHHEVRRILANAKYIGTWVWGATRAMRDSKGNKKQVPAPPDEVVQRSRPELRIIDDATWNSAQERLSELKAKFGQKPGLQRRGPRTHYTQTYPKSLLGGLLFCSECGSRLIHQAGGADVYYGCPQHRNQLCKTTVRVPRRRGEEALISFIQKELTRQPEWMKAVMDALSACTKEVTARLPSESELKAKQRDKLQREISNLMEALAQGGMQSQTVLTGIRERESQVAQLKAELDEYHRLESVPQELPKESEVHASLTQLASVLREKSQQASLLLRRVLGKVYLHEVPIPGKKRGYVQLRFKIKAWRVAMELFKDLPSITFLMDGHDDMETPTVCLNVGGPTKMDQLAPKIAELREQGVPWNEIGRRTGLQPGNAFTAWKRFVDSGGGDAKTG